MAVRPIVIYGDPVLRTVSAPVGEITENIRTLVADMIDTLKEAEGLGLAAVQVGVPVRLFLVDVSAIDIAKPLMVFINPKIIGTTGEIELEEGCLSIPGVFNKVTRPERVIVQATGLDGNSFELECDGMCARAVLHEYDHLEGKLFIDHLSMISRSLLSGKLKKLAQESAA